MNRAELHYYHYGDTMNEEEEDEADDVSRNDYDSSDDYDEHGEYVGDAYLDQKVLEKEFSDQDDVSNDDDMFETGNVEVLEEEPDIVDAGPGEYQPKDKDLRTYVAYSGRKFRRLVRLAPPLATSFPVAYERLKYKYTEYREKNWENRMRLACKVYFSKMVRNKVTVSATAIEEFITHEIAVGHFMELDGKTFWDESNVVVRTGERKIAPPKRKGSGRKKNQPDPHRPIIDFSNPNRKLRRLLKFGPGYSSDNAGDGPSLVEIWDTIQVLAVWALTFIDGLSVVLHRPTQQLIALCGLIAQTIWGFAKLTKRVVTLSIGALVRGRIWAQQHDDVVADTLSTWYGILVLIGSLWFVVRFRKVIFLCFCALVIDVFLKIGLLLRMVTWIWCVLVLVIWVWCNVVSVLLYMFVYIIALVFLCGGVVLVAVIIGSVVVKLFTQFVLRTWFEHRRQPVLAGPAYAGDIAGDGPNNAQDARKRTHKEAKTNRHRSDGVKVKIQYGPSGQKVCRNAVDGGCSKPGCKFYHPVVSQPPEPGSDEPTPTDAGEGSTAEPHVATPQEIADKDRKLATIYIKQDGWFWWWRMLLGLLWRWCDESFFTPNANHVAQERGDLEGLLHVREDRVLLWHLLPIYFIPFKDAFNIHERIGYTHVRHALISEVIYNKLAEECYSATNGDRVMHTLAFVSSKYLPLYPEQVVNDTICKFKNGLEEREFMFRQFLSSPQIPYR